MPGQCSQLGQNDVLDSRLRGLMIPNWTPHLPLKDNYTQVWKLSQLATHHLAISALHALEHPLCDSIPNMPAFTNQFTYITTTIREMHSCHRLIIMSGRETTFLEYWGTLPTVVVTVSEQLRH